MPAAPVPPAAPSHLGIYIYVHVHPPHHAHACAEMADAVSRSWEGDAIKNGRQPPPRPPASIIMHGWIHPWIPHA